MNLFRTSIIAVIAAAITVTTKIATVMSTIPPESTEIAAAASSHKYVFIAYIVVLAVTVILSVLVWTSNNKVQDAIKRDAEARIEEARRDAATAKEKTEELKQQNLTTEERLEQERLARIEIEERVAFRRIPERQRSGLASRLKSFAGQSVSLWFDAGDREGAIFASDIASTLDAAQWDVSAPAARLSLAAAVESGVIVVSTGHEGSIKASDAIVREIGALGFDIRKSPKTENRPAAEIFVNVKARPEGAQGEGKLRKQAK